MKTTDRRHFIAQSALIGAAAAVAGVSSLQAQSTDPNRKFTICLSPGAIGVVVADTDHLIDLAHGYGFESIEARGAELAGMDAEELKELVAEMRSKRVAWGYAGLPVEFRQDDAKFAEGLKALPPIAAALQKAGVTRVSTWISPAHDTLTYKENFDRHTRRLREVAKILKEHSLRFGLEYVGTPTLRKAKAHEFIYNLKQTRELIAAINTGNVGVVLDSWHWWTSGETGKELATVTNAEVVSVDLNDAPKGIPVDQQIDGERELAASTGVIDIGTFVKALAKMGYDGPVRAE
ncbi:MAG TPA: TIM barrel protein, partial [Roseimicrobium sp.]|nr:TIM barrel protein [Roseimicrobium sp.]